MVSIRRGAVGRTFMWTLSDWDRCRRGQEGEGGGNALTFSLEELS